MGIIQRIQVDRAQNLTYSESFLQVCVSLCRHWSQALNYRSKHSE